MVYTMGGHSKGNERKVGMKEREGRGKTWKGGEGGKNMKERKQEI